MDHIEALVRGARPSSGHRNLPLTDRAEQELSEFLGSAPPQSAGRRPNPRRSRRASVLSRATLLSLLTALFAAVVFVTGVANPRAVHATAPAPLTFAPIDTPASELLNELAALTRSRPMPEYPQVVNVESWAEVATQITTADGRTVLQPQLTTVVRASDGSRTLSIVAAAPRTPDGRLATSDMGGPTPGDLLFFDFREPGDEEAFVGEVPTDLDAVSAFLRQRIDNTHPTGADYLTAVSWLLSVRAIGGPQEAALWQFLATLDDVEVVGVGTDRLDRPGVAFRAAGGLGNTHYVYLIISPTTGRRLAVETVISEPELDSARVTHYQHWLDDAYPIR